MTLKDRLNTKFQAFDMAGKLIAVLAITSIIAWLMGLVFTPAYRLFVLPSGFIPPLLQPWSYITHGFIHGSIWHFVGNAFGIYIAGRYILNIFSGRQFLTIFFLLINASLMVSLASSGTPRELIKDST